MQPELEAKFLAVDFDSIRARLRDAGAQCVVPMRLMKRKGYDFPGRVLQKTKNGWVRVRDEGNKITMAYKQLDNRNIDGTKEIELAVDSFETACAFLETIGLVSEVRQETKRESWRLGDCHIELDEWPWAKTYIEIEGPSEAALRQAAQQLGLDWNTVCHGSVEIVYRGEFDVTDDEINAIPLFSFETPIPDWLEKRRRR